MIQETQTKKFKESWDEHHKLYGTESWESEPDFLYYVMGIIPDPIGKVLVEHREDFLASQNISGGYKIKAEDLHVTLALPGRLGTHFQKNDIRYMQKTLRNIFLDCKKIPLIIHNFNVFSNIIYAEVYDSTSQLQQLHETICTEIPFSQHPEYRYQYFKPHISVLYGGVPEKTLQLEAKRNFNPIEIEISEIILGKTKGEAFNSMSPFSEAHIIEKFILEDETV